MHTDIKNSRLIKSLKIKSVQVCTSMEHKRSVKGKSRIWRFKVRTHEGQSRSISNIMWSVFPNLWGKTILNSNKMFQLAFCIYDMLTWGFFLVCFDIGGSLLCVILGYTFFLLLQSKRLVHSFLYFRGRI